jgi:hypothetical protein
MTTLAAARRYRSLGLSVIPIRPDGRKAPALDSWKEFQRRLPTERELVEWFDRDSPPGVAVVCGRVSGGLEVLDFETDASYREWAALVEGEAPGLLASLPRARTPRGGRHVYVRTPNPGPNRKLARDEGGATLVEVRGQGGYVLAPGCPAVCHPGGGLYVWEVDFADAAAGVAG